MIKYLTHQYALKQKSRQIHEFVKNSYSHSDLSQNSIFKILIVDEVLDYDDILVLMSISNRLHDLLNKIEFINLGHCNILRSLCVASTGQSLDVVQSVYPISDGDIRRTLGIETNNWKSLGLENKHTTHPFPEELKSQPVFSSWQSLWMLNNKSQPNFPFIPPILPAQCFEGKSKSFEYRSTWKKGTTPSSHEQFGVVVRNNNCVVGAMNWYWWGSAGHIQGIELYVCLKNRENLINFIIDIRPTESLPTFGPNLTESSFLSQDSTNRLADIVDLISEYKYQSKVYGH